MVGYSLPMIDISFPSCQQKGEEEKPWWILLAVFDSDPRAKYCDLPEDSWKPEDKASPSIQPFEPKFLLGGPGDLLPSDSS